LRKHAPKEIKEKLNDEQAAGRHDIWLLDEHWNGKEIFPAVRDTIRIRLEETPTSGYTWLLQNQPVGMQLLEDKYQGDETAIGGTRIHEFVGSLAEDAQDSKLIIKKSRPWDQDETKAQFAIQIHPQEIRKTGPLVLPKLG
jgi:predicted secreted protein